MSGREIHKPIMCWAVMVGDQLIPHLPSTRREARNMLSTRSRMEKLRPELCQEKGRAHVVRIEVRIVEGGR